MLMEEVKGGSSCRGRPCVTLTLRFLSEGAWVGGARSNKMQGPGKHSYRFLGISLYIVQSF